MQILIEHTQWHCNCHYINLSSEELISFNSFTTNSIIFVPSNYDFKLHFWLVPFLLSSESNELQEILETREKAKPHIWTFRTPDEANSHWKNLFGHLDEMEWWIYNFYNFINLTLFFRFYSIGSGKSESYNWLMPTGSALVLVVERVIRDPLHNQVKCNNNFFIKKLFCLSWLFLKSDLCIC